MSNCFAALGTDSGGGIRIPASHCGIIGFKPTYGRVSLRGIVPFAWSLDHCGPLARTAEDAALVLQQIAGYDHLDIDSVDKPVPDYLAGLDAPVAQFRIGIAAQFFDHLDDEVARAVEEALAVLNKLTKGSHEVGLPSLLHAGVSAEIAAYHENLRGVNGGGYEPATARVFPAAQDATKAVDYVRGWRELAMVRRTVDEDVFRKQNVDVLVAPVVRHLPALIEEDLNPAGRRRRRQRRQRRRRWRRRNADARPQQPEPRALPTPKRIPGPSTATASRSSPSPAASPKKACPSDSRSPRPLFAESSVLALAHAYQQAHRLA